MVFPRSKALAVPVIEGLLRERQENGLFQSIKDFVERMTGKDLNKRVIGKLHQGRGTGWPWSDQTPAYDDLCLSHGSGGTGTEKQSVRSDESL